MEVKYKLVPVEPTPEMLKEIHLIEEFTVNALRARYSAMIKAAPDQLSDLEIVQKALDKIKLVDHRSANVDFFGNGSWVVWNYSINAAHQVADGSDLESLLTWAKQTVGEQ